MTDFANKNNHLKQFIVLIVITVAVFILTTWVIAVLFDKGVFNFGAILDFSFKDVFKPFAEYYVIFGGFGTLIILYCAYRVLKISGGQDGYSNLSFMVKWWRSEIVIGYLVMFLSIVLGRLIPQISFFIAPLSIIIMIPFTVLYVGLVYILKNW